MIWGHFLSSKYSGSGPKVRVTTQMPEVQPESQGFSSIDSQNLSQIAPNKCLNRILVILLQRGLKPS